MSYIDVQDLRAEGVTDAAYAEPYLLERIALAQQFIELVTGRFFEKRAGLTLSVSGRGHNRLWLPIPPIAITSVAIDGVVLASTEYRIVMPTFPDGRFDPKLDRVASIWPKGSDNITVVGDFGFVDTVAGTPVAYVAPKLIKDICKRIAIWALPQLGNSDAQRARQIVEESLKDYRYRLSESTTSGGLFGDPAIDNILAQFRRREITTV